MLKSIVAGAPDALASAMAARSVHWDPTVDRLVSQMPSLKLASVPSPVWLTVKLALLDCKTCAKGWSAARKTRLWRASGDRRRDRPAAKAGRSAAVVGWAASPSEPAAGCSPTMRATVRLPAGGSTTRASAPELAPPLTLTSLPAPTGIWLLATGSRLHACMGRTLGGITPAGFPAETLQQKPGQ